MEDTSRRWSTPVTRDWEGEGHQKSKVEVHEEQLRRGTADADSCSFASGIEPLTRTALEIESILLGSALS
jgi:hypothetical protein